MAFPFKQPRIARDAKFSSSEREVSERLASRINSVLRRRLSDRIEVVLRAARLAGDQETADEHRNLDSVVIYAELVRTHGSTADPANVICPASKLHGVPMKYSGNMQS